MSSLKAIVRSTPGLYALLSLRYRFRTWYYGRLNETRYQQALKRWYLRRTGESLDLENPRTFNEKIQWMNLYDCTPEKILLTDKYMVRQWVADRIGEKHLIPLLGVWKSAHDIDFSVLPDRFVLKANHGSAWNVIVRDKSELNVKRARKRLNYWLHLNYAFFAFERQYRDIPPLIIAEKYFENIDKDLYDYKFLCFDGEPRYCWVDMDRHTDHKRSMFDLNFEPQPFTINDHYPKIDRPVRKPENFDEMIVLAKTLCEGFKHVRVDLYNVDGKIYFGEMTFTCEAGIAKIRPPEYATLLGDMIRLLG